MTREHMRSLSLPADEVKAGWRTENPMWVRLKVPRHEEVRFEDRIRGWVVVQSSHIDDKVLFKSDGMPTYHLASIVDDHLMRWRTWCGARSGCPAPPARAVVPGLRLGTAGFAHLPLILKPDGNAGN